MTKTYLISEEVLLEVLEALEPTPPNPLSTYNIIKTILASPPAEPVAWMNKHGYPVSEAWMSYNSPFAMIDEFKIPLYRKDTP